MIRGCDLTMTGEVWEYRPESHKNTHRGQGRTVFLNANARDVVRRYLTTDLSAYLFSPTAVVAAKRAERAAKRVTPKSCGNRAGTNRKRQPRKVPGKRYTTSSYYAAVRVACQKADIPHIAPNRLRHTFGMKLAQQHGGRRQRRCSATRATGRPNAIPRRPPTRPATWRGWCWRASEGRPGVEARRVRDRDSHAGMVVAGQSFAVTNRLR